MGTPLEDIAGSFAAHLRPSSDDDLLGCHHSGPRGYRHRSRNNARVLPPGRCTCPTMLSLSNRRIFISQKPTDMRRGIDTLSSTVSSELGHDPYAGDVFVFVGKDRRRIKILVWDISGYWLSMKRLEKGTFAAPPPPALDVAGHPVRQLSSAELQLVLEGVVVHRATYHTHYNRASQQRLVNP